MKEIKENIYNWFAVKVVMIFMSILFMSALTSCRDDFEGPYKQIEETGNVTIHVPSVKGVVATRSNKVDDPAAEGEGQINKLVLYAYPSEGGEVKRFPLASPVALTHEYATYKITLDPGKYRVYLTGNLEDYYGDEIDEKIEEPDLKKLLLNFNSDLLPVKGNLPMAALPEDILENLEGEVDIPAYRGGKITADLKFLCSKVRLSVFFDNSGADSFSTSGFGAWIPQFDAFDLTNLADATRLDVNETLSHDLFNHYGLFTKMKYPGGISTEEDVRNFNGLDSMVPEADQEGHSASQMAWQTIQYLPENLNTDLSKGTSLTLNGRLEGNSNTFRYHLALPGKDTEGETPTAKPLRRAHFHDYTACLKAISEFKVNSRVEPWTVLSLVHKLHGPYFLQVEKTENVPVTAGEETHLWYKSDVPVSFQSQQAVVNGKTINILQVDTMPGHGKDSIVIAANPLLPVNYDLEETYFDVIAGNIKKRIQISPFVVQPFFKVTPPYTAVEVREMIESSSNSIRIPIHFTTNLEKVDVRITDGWGNDIPVEFKISGDVTNQEEGIVVYEGDLAHDGYNFVEMEGFLKGNPYWQENHTLKLEYRAYMEDGLQFGPTRNVEIEIIPKRFNYRIYFRPEGDDWAAPHVYIYESLALPYVIDQSKVQGPYKNRAGKPVGGYVYRNDATEAGLAYSFTGKVSFLGWSSQGGPEANDPYEDVEFDPVTADGFYVFGTMQSNVGSVAGKTGYGLKYIPPANRTEWMKSGPSEAESRRHYDIDTDHMAAHRSQLTELCPSCQKTDTYNMKFPGIRMLPSKTHPGWFYVDLTEVASPGKALIMFHDGHPSDGNLIVPGDHKPGVPLFDFPDNEGWMYYGSGNASFVNDKPADKRQYKEDTYRLIFPKRGYTGIKLGMMDARDALFQGYFYETKDPSGYKTWDENFNYVEFKLSDQLNSHYITATLFSDAIGDVDEKLWLYRFQDIAGIKYYTYTGVDEGHPGLPTADDADTNVYRIYWVSNGDVRGFNMWFDGYVFNNFDNASQQYIESMEYISGTEDYGGRKYDYFEFIIPRRTYNNHGWQMHTWSKGQYAYLSYVDITDFQDRDGTGIYSVFRDEYYTLRSGRPYNPQGNDFRIYWPKYYTSGGTTYDIKSAWVWSITLTEGDEATTGTWISPDGTEEIDGVSHYYFDFSDSSNFDNPYGGIIPRTDGAWGVGFQPNTSNLLFSRFQFDYDASKGKNVMIITSDFKASK